MDAYASALPDIFVVAASLINFNMLILEILEEAPSFPTCTRLINQSQTDKCPFSLCLQFAFKWLGLIILKFIMYVCNQYETEQNIDNILKVKCKIKQLWDTEIG